MKDSTRLIASTHLPCTPKNAKDGYMRLLVLLVLGAACAAADDSAYEPLKLYHGKWQAVMADAAAKPDELVDECGRIGKYFTCQQTVNGKIGALLIFVPAETAGHYFTNSVTSEGWANGRGELEITGDRWLYSSKSQDGKHHRTLNQFTGRDKIHFEISESSDGENWKVLRSGDEVRVK